MNQSQTTHHRWRCHTNTMRQMQAQSEPSCCLHHTYTSWDRSGHRRRHIQTFRGRHVHNRHRRREHLPHGHGRHHGRRGRGRRRHRHDHPHALARWLQHWWLLSVLLLLEQVLLLLLLAALPLLLLVLEQRMAWLLL
jgi:hypothetical protein